MGRVFSGRYISYYIHFENFYMLSILNKNLATISVLIFNIFCLKINIYLKKSFLNPTGHIIWLYIDLYYMAFRVLDRRLS